MKNLPSGTVTFLFTDIEGSTKLAQGHPNQWETLRERHHAILQTRMDAHNGYVFQVIGDAFCVAFHTAGDALGAAVKSQIDLFNEEWGDTPIKVRMGIHTGKAELQSDGQYHGYLALSRVQRLMSAAHGGQVLISLPTEELVRDDLPEDVSLRDMGERRLKDLIRPEHVYQLVISNLPADFPPIKTLDAYRHNLPVQLTSFIGREKEMDELKESILTNRLITLTGVGGTGKTRLALHVAADVLDNFHDGVWLVELAPLSDPALIPQVVATTLGLREQTGRIFLEALKDYLSGKSSLLLLDNCEHVIEACAQLADALLHSVPQLKILATSREALGIAGEFIYPVRSLSLPDSRQPSPEVLSQFDAVRLFIDRAIAVQPNFQVTNQNALAVAQVCSRLDGIPLAIELAAARVKGLSVEQIASRLDDRFRLLTGGSRTALPRQRTLQATIDWSYNLLSEDERVLLRRLTVFMGGWTLEAAEQVCTSDGLCSEQILDLLLRLVDKSLVIADTEASEPRYHMLETIRQYAQEKMIEFENDKIVRAKHLDFFLQLAENAEQQLIGPDQVHWLDYLEREHDNFRAALEWSMQEGRRDDALQMAGALGIFWFKHTHFSEGRRWFRYILDGQQDSSEQAQVKASRWVGLLTFNQGELTETKRIYKENLEREQALGDWVGIAFSVHMLANVAQYEGDLEEARDLHEKSIELSRQIDAPWILAMAQLCLGTLEQVQGNPELAEISYRESLNNFRLIGEKWGIAASLENLGFLMHSKREFIAAKKILLESFEVSMELGNKDGMIYTLAGLASIFQQEEKYIIGAHLQGVVAAKLREYGIWLQPMEQDVFNVTAETLKRFMGEQAYQHELEIGMSFTLEEAVSLASGGK